MKKIFNFFTLVNFKILKKNKILIFGSQNLFEIKKIIKKKTDILDLNKEINFFILIEMLLNLKFKRSDYIFFFIKRINPKFILSSADNDINVYNIKNHFPNVVTILIQNGRRGGMIDIFNQEFKKKLNKKKQVDHFFVFGKAIEKKFSQFVNSKYYSTGSIKNNFNKIIKQKYKYDNKILFISQFRPNNKPLWKYENKTYNYNEIYKNDKKLVFELSKFCKKNNLNLYILPSHNKSSKYFQEEINFFNKIIKNFDQIKILNKDKVYDSYKHLNNFEIIFGLESTLMYESLPRYKKLAFFSRFENINNYRFAWPLNEQKKGFFFSNKINQSEIKRIYNNLLKIPKSEWINYTKKYRKQLMCFDYKNKQLTKLIRNII